jgi:hypothetical protein
MTDLLTQLAQPGDRWKIAGRPATPDNNTLPLDPSWDMLLAANEPVSLVVSDQPARPVRYDPDRHALIGPGLGGWMSRGRRAAHFATSVGFDNLISLPLLREIELLPTS